MFRLPKNDIAHTSEPLSLQVPHAFTKRYATHAYIHTNSAVNSTRNLRRTKGNSEYECRTYR